MKVIKAVYNFFVGDMVILIGIAFTVIILALVENVSPLEPIRAFIGLILVLGVLASLILTLIREVKW